MQDMISRLVEIDQKAREITDRANALKEKSKRKIEQKKLELRDDYLARARARIEKTKETLEADAARRWEQLKAEHDATRLRFEAQCRDHLDVWVETIVSRAIGR